MGSHWPNQDCLWQEKAHPGDWRECHREEWEWSIMLKQFEFCVYICTAYPIYDNWDIWAPCKLHDVTNTVLTMWTLCSFFRKDSANMVNTNMAGELWRHIAGRKMWRKWDVKFLLVTTALYVIKEKKGRVNYNNSQRTLILVWKSRLEPQNLKIQKMFFARETNTIKQIIYFLDENLSYDLTHV